jgi:hypothetical protein
VAKADITLSVFYHQAKAAVQNIQLQFLNQQVLISIFYTPVKDKLMLVYFSLVINLSLRQLIQKPN